MSGPAPQPTKLKQLRGNPGKRALNDREPQPTAIVEMPEPPEFLDGLARRFWRVEGAKLLKLGLITEIDLMSWAGCSTAYALYAAVTEALKGQALTIESGHGVYANPLLKIQDMAFKQLRSVAAGFGMDPSSRTRIKVPDAPKEDPFESFLGRGGLKSGPKP